MKPGHRPRRWQQPPRSQRPRSGTRSRTVSSSNRFPSQNRYQLLVEDSGWVGLRYCKNYSFGVKIGIAYISYEVIIIWWHCSNAVNLSNSWGLIIFLVGLSGVFLTVGFLSFVLIPLNTWLLGHSAAICSCQIFLNWPLTSCESCGLFELKFPSLAFSKSFSYLKLFSNSRICKCGPVVAPSVF